MDIKFEPQEIKLIIFLTSAEAKELLMDLPPMDMLGHRPLLKLARALSNISQMNSDAVLRESETEYSLAERAAVQSERPGQSTDSRP